MRSFQLENGGKPVEVVLVYGDCMEMAVAGVPRAKYGTCFDSESILLIINRNKLVPISDWCFKMGTVSINY